MISYGSINDSVEHLFRHNAGRMSAVLTRIFGFEKIDLIEDAVQESMVRALRQWSIKGIPDNPSAWLIQVAKNYILDRLRKSSRDSDLSDVTRRLEQFAEGASDSDNVYFESEIREDQLRMIFACCHPSLTPDSRIALTLRTVGGFSVNEIARAFLSNREAIAKLLFRAKSRIREDGGRISIPEPSEITHRLEEVLKVLYLMFNEGYSATAGESAVRKDLCGEAIRLARLLAQHPLTSSPKVHALTALFLFQASRLSARSGEDGSLVLLAEQDRTLWDKKLIAEGLRHLRRSAGGEELSVYHLEAEIASYHAVSEDFSSTDWASVLSSYDELIARRASPIAALNRIVALAEVEGPEAALAALDGISDGKLEAYYPYHVTRAELKSRLGDTRGALASYEFAAGLIENDAVKRFVEGRIQNCNDQHARDP